MLVLSDQKNPEKIAKLQTGFHKLNVDRESIAALKGPSAAKCRRQYKIKNLKHAITTEQSWQMK